MTRVTGTCACGCVPIDRRKPDATIEGRRANARHTVGNCNARKPGATREGRRAYARHATVCGNNTVFATCYQCFAFRFNKAISCAMIFCIFFCNSNARKPRATREGRRADARHTVWNSNARKTGTTSEGIISNA